MTKVCKYSKYNDKKKEVCPALSWVKASQSWSSLTKRTHFQMLEETIHGPLGYDPSSYFLMYPLPYHVFWAAFLAVFIELINTKIK